MKAIMVALAICGAGVVAVAQEAEQEDARELRTSRTPLRQASDPAARWMLLRREPVQVELGLSEEVIKQLQKTYDEKAAALPESGRRTFASSAEFRREFGETAKKLLDEKQQARLLQIYLHVMDVRAVMQPEVAEKLQFSDEQKKQLEELASRTGFGFGGVDDRGRPTYAKSRDIAAVLTADQKKQFEAMKGKPFDVRQLWGSGVDRFESKDKRQAKTQWEYRVEYGKVDLQRLGEEGWELVAVLPEVSQTSRNSGGGRGRSEKEFYFKRVKP